MQVMVVFSSFIQSWNCYDKKWTLIDFVLACDVIILFKLMTSGHLFGSKSVMRGHIYDCSLDAATADLTD